MSVRILHAALDEVDGRIILRGRIAPGSFGELQIPPYQREVLPREKIGDLKTALRDPASSVPDLDLGMRGGNFSEDKKAPHDYGDVLLLHDPVMIIDGLQRTTAAIQLLLEGFEARMGAMIHFNTTEEWERERFRILNVARTKLSPNVLLRNLRADYPAIETLYNLTFDSSFVLCGKIAWDQNQRRHHLMSAFTFVKTVAMLHSHLGSLMSNQLDELVPNLQKMMTDRVGRNTMRSNIDTFFGTVDAAWGIREVAVSELAVYLRSTFLRTLARVFSEHINFWNDQKLCVDSDYVDRLKTFKITDPNVALLASGSGNSHIMLRQMLIDHISSGKRTRRLKARVMAS